MGSFNVQIKMLKMLSKKFEYIFYHWKLSFNMLAKKKQEKTLKDRVIEIMIPSLAAILKSS